ncbi:MAG: hypothetical protein AAE975_01340 [Thermoplasmatales archaeon]|jgi:hypothetical protein
MVITSGSIPRVSGQFEMGLGSQVESISTSITATWSWYNKLMGIVSWNFKNNSAFQETAVLYRSGYFFGNAYFPIYLENGVSMWGTQLAPLTNRGIDRNTMPLGIVDFGQGNRIIAFLFTFDPGQSWSVLEGGFSARSPPSNGVLFGAMLEKTGSFCIGYDPKQVTDYDRQTSTSLKGYSPNPSYVKTVEVAISTFAQFVQLFPGDTISDRPCQNQNEVVVQEESNVAPGDIEEIVGNIVRVIRSF